MVSDVFEAHLAGVECGGLLCIADPEAYVVEAVENTDFGLQKSFSRLPMSLTLSVGLA